MRSKRRRILAKFLAHVGSACVRCAMWLHGDVLDMTCAQRHAFEKYTILFPTFCLRLPLSVRDEMFGNGFHARIGTAILPALSSGCEWYCLPSASQRHVAGYFPGLPSPRVNDWDWIPRWRRGRDVLRRRHQGPGGTVFPRRPNLCRSMFAYSVFALLSVCAFTLEWCSRRRAGHNSGDVF